MESDRRNGYVAIAVIVAIALAWLAGRFMSAPSDSQAASVTAPSPSLPSYYPPSDPCERLPVAEKVEGIELHLCEEDRGDQMDIDVRNEAGDQVYTVKANTRFRYFENQTIKRGRGHVDTQVCFVDGSHAGQVGWVKGTHFFNGRCDHREMKMR